MLKKAVDNLKLEQLYCKQKGCLHFIVEDKKKTKENHYLIIMVLEMNSVQEKIKARAQHWKKNKIY